MLQYQSRPDESTNRSPRVPVEGLFEALDATSLTAAFFAFKYAAASQDRVALDCGAIALRRTDDRGLSLCRISNLAPHSLTRALSTTVQSRSRTFRHSGKCGVQANRRILKAQYTVSELAWLHNLHPCPISCPRLTDNG